MKDCIYKIFITIALTIISVANAMAQNNPYKIQDNLYAIWDKATTTFDEKERLALGREMYDKALAQKDYKACVLSYVSNMTFYSRTRNTAKLNEWAETTRAIAVKYNYMQYFFHAYSLQASMYLNNGQLVKALEISDRMLEDGKKYKSDFGLATAHSTIGNIYFKNAMFGEAIQYYTKALPYYEKAKQHTSSVLNNLAACYYSSNDYATAEQYSKQAIKASLVERNNGNLYAHLLNIQSTDYIYNPTQAKRQTIDSTYSQLLTLLDKYGDTGHASIKTGLATYYIATDQKSLAKEHIPQVHGTDSTRCLRLSAIKENDLGKYLDLVKRERQTSIQSINYLTRQLAIYQAAKLGNDVLTREKHELILENQNLELTNTNLELMREKENALLEQSLLKNKNLELQNKNITLEHKQAEAKASMEKLQLQKEKERQHKWYVINLSILLGIIIFLLVLYAYSRNRLIKKLNKTNDQLTKAKAEAEHANSMKTIFVQNMSHEIRTPLNAICGFSQILSDPEMWDLLENEDKLEYGRIIEANTNMLTNIINDILDLGKIQNGKYTMIYGESKPKAVCQEAIDTVSIRIPNNVEMKLDFQLPEDTTIISDHNRIKQVVINFLTNACKNTTKGSITLSAYPIGDDMIGFSVADTGVGIDPSKSERLFQRFEKLDAYKQGTGLGLSICRSISDALHGKIYLDTTYTGGARFVFEVPRQET